MNRKPYSQILDAVAGDHVPHDLDLAPNIKARVQKGKGIRMQSRMKLVSAILLVAIAFAVLFYTVPGVAAAIGRWFGYVPGVGLVREGLVRVLAEPVSVTREGVTVTVDQVVLNQERATLLYSADGIPSTAMINGQIEKTQCPYSVSLRLPDGTPLLASPNGIQSWPSGYQHRFDFPPVPAAVNEATLVINCLYQTLPGAAPENWEIPLRFAPATAEMTAFPVIEIATPTAPAETETPAAAADAPVTPSAASPTAAPADGLSLTLDRAVQMDDGYLLYATLHWEDAPFMMVDVTDVEKTLHLLDANGQEMLYEVRYDENTRVDVDGRQTVFAVKTAPVQVPGPLTLTLDAVSVDLPVDASFVFDPGANPQPGQEWKPDVELTFGERRLRVRSIVTDGSGYSLDMISDSGIFNAGCTDHEHTILSGFSGGGGQIDEKTYSFGCGFNYQDGLPEGPITISVGSISIQHPGPFQAQWTPPATSSAALPTQSPACLTAETWKAALAQKPTLPDGLGGTVLTSGPLVDEEWGLTVSNLDGSNPQVIPGGQGGALSPNGRLLAYATTDAGILIMDRATGQSTPLPGTGHGDFNPLWTPDSQQIVFNRGMGVFDLFLVNLDGSGLRQLTQGGVQEWPMGWLPGGGTLLYSVPGREYEQTIYQLDMQSGASQEFSRENVMAISPNGQRMAVAEWTFGDRFMVSVDGQRLNDASLWLLNPIWSPDGRWLLAGVSDTDAGSLVGALIDPQTCQVVPLPELKGNIHSWTP